MKSRNFGGTLGRVYGGDCNLIHVADGNRKNVGHAAAQFIDGRMREDAFKEGRRSYTEAKEQALCPGCYMVVGFNTMVELAKANGQSLAELGRTMATAFKKLEQCQTDACIEEITVMLDPDVVEEAA